MNSIHVTILAGKDLSKNAVETINQARLQEFGSTNAIVLQPNNENWEKIYFLAKDANRLVAFGRLHDVDVTFRSETYSIFGIATVIALEKGKGYGKLLMEEIKDYILKSGKTGLGFCNKTITIFYEKCGFGIIKEGQKRFHHSAPPRFQDSDAVYIGGKDDLIKKLFEYPHENAQVSRPHW